MRLCRPFTELITCCPSCIFRVVGVAAEYLHNSYSDMVNIFSLHSRELPKIAIFRTLTMIFCPRKRSYFLRHTSAAVVFASLNTVGKSNYLCHPILISSSKKQNSLRYSKAQEEKFLKFHVFHFIAQY